MKDPDIEALVKACGHAANDGEKLKHNASYARYVLGTTKWGATAGINRESIRFLRQLLYAWLDAPDFEARALIRRTISEHLSRPDMQVAA